MADPTGQPASAVEAALAVEPYRFDFLQALRLLERAHAGMPRLGRARRAAQEPIRLGQEPHLAFPPANLSAFVPGGTAGPARLWVRFFGLFGPHGPLPTHLTDYARRRQDQERDPTFARFADIFHHRLLLLFYRAWADAQPAVDHDRPDEARYAGYVGGLAGIGPRPVAASDRWQRDAELFHAGYLAGQTRHASGLRQALQQLFEVGVAIESFAGGWLTLPEETRLYLGIRGRLGVDAVAGARSFQRQHRFRIRLGPLGFADFQRFLPGSRSLGRLQEIVRLAVGDALEWDLQLVLKHDEVPAARLDGRTRLGLTSWFGWPARRRDADDLVLDIDRLRTVRAQAH
ncbi:MAG TPA: type VI secretion system baseplate subunit TssG [Geminicoccaceae bacterium]|nr:type VI secretion system baseplate subunit TssG [Geminicoccaceae bacterium]